jgi:hypothetical protein
MDSRSRGNAHTALRLMPQPQYNDLLFAPGDLLFGLRRVLVTTRAARRRDL